MALLIIGASASERLNSSGGKVGNSGGAVGSRKSENSSSSSSINNSINDSKAKNKASIGPPAPDDTSCRPRLGIY